MLLLQPFTSPHNQQDLSTWSLKNLDKTSLTLYGYKYMCQLKFQLKRTWKFYTD